MKIPKKTRADKVVRLSPDGSGMVNGQDPSPLGGDCPAAGEPSKSALRSALKRGQTPEAAEAEYMSAGVVMNAIVGREFSAKLGSLDLTECVSHMSAAAEQATSGDLRGQEAILSAQVVSLNAIYTECVTLAKGNIHQGLDVFDRLMRIGLKAQSQSRATAESLALMQSPPTVFAKQANIANGPQQINNGAALPSRAGKTQSEPSKLLEAHGERLDDGTARQAISGDQELAAMGAVHRSAKRRR